MEKAHKDQDEIIGHWKDGIDDGSGIRSMMPYSYNPHKMKKHITLIFLTFLIQTGTSFSQSLDDLYHSFKVPITWKKSLHTDTSFGAFYDKGKVAMMTLTKGKRQIEIVIFDKSILNDTAFIKANKEYNASSSCLNYNTDGNHRFFSYTSSRFYITPMLCPRCNFYKDRNCKRIQKAYNQWADLWSIF